MNGLNAIWAARGMYVQGLETSLLLIGACLLISLPLALAVYVLLQESPASVRRAVRLLLDTLRCVPYLLLAYVVYYGLPVVGLRFGAFSAGLTSLTIYHSAYFVEALLSASLSIPAESLMAAEAFGFSRYTRYRRIVFPQLLSLAAPVLGNQAVMVIKDSALLMIITVQEITFAANFVSANNFSPFAPFLLAMLLYWLISLMTDCAFSYLGRYRLR